MTKNVSGPTTNVTGPGRTANYYGPTRNWNVNPGGGSWNVSNPSYGGGVNYAWPPNYNLYNPPAVVGANPFPPEYYLLNPVVPNIGPKTKVVERVKEEITTPKTDSDQDKDKDPIK